MLEFRKIFSAAAVSSSSNPRGSKCKYVSRTSPYCTVLIYEHVRRSKYKTKNTKYVLNYHSLLKFHVKIVILEEEMHVLTEPHLLQYCIQHRMDVMRKIGIEGKNDWRGGSIKHNHQLYDRRTHPLFTYWHRRATLKEILYGLIYNPTVRAFFYMLIGLSSKSEIYLLYRTAFHDKKRSGLGGSLFE